MVRRFEGIEHVENDVALVAIALVAVVTLQGVVHAAGRYDFVKLVDHVEHNYSPRSFTCASIKEAGDIAFKASRSAPDGLSFWDVITRVSRTGVITTIVEDPNRTQFQFFGHFVSIDDSAQTSFGVFLSNDEREIIRADATSRVTIASTAGAFDAFGFDTQLNNSGEVAFTGQLVDGNRGLFSGAGGAVTTHYLDTTPVFVDGVPTDLFGGNFGRPAINTARRARVLRFRGARLQPGHFRRTRREFSDAGPRGVEPPVSRSEP